MLTPGLAALGIRAFRLVVLRFLRNVADDGVAGHAHDPAVEQAVAREVERVDLDLRFLAGVHEADVAVRDHGLDFERGIGRHDHGQLLGGVTTPPTVCTASC